MGGFFGVASREDCLLDLFFGTDYHSHLGTRRAGMAVYRQDTGFNRAIHNIENSPFRTKFDKDVNEMEGNLGIGCISDYDPQPLIVRSHHGTYAIVTVGRINNTEELVGLRVPGGALPLFGDERRGHQRHRAGGLPHQFERGPGGGPALCPGFHRRLYDHPAADTPGAVRLPGQDGPHPGGHRQKEGAYCASFESFAYLNLGYTSYRELGPGEVALITPEGVTTLVEPRKEMKICTFLWVYYGYPSSSYEGVSVEGMRYRCGEHMAQRDTVEVDTVAGVPDSGLAHAIGYANASGVPFSRPLIKYTPTWPRSFMPTTQKQRDVIAKMKLIPVHELIQNKRLLLIDDSIVRGTQLKDTTDFLFKSGAKEVHVRPACPPPAVQLQVPELLPVHHFHGPDHPPGHQGDGGHRPSPEPGALRGPRDLRVPEDGGDHRQAAALYHPALPQAGRHDGLCGHRQVQAVHLLLERQRVIPK